MYELCSDFKMNHNYNLPVSAKSEIPSKYACKHYNEKVTSLALLSSQVCKHQS